jgi:hypothetical protein
MKILAGGKLKIKKPIEILSKLHAIAAPRFAT